MREQGGCSGAEPVGKAGGAHTHPAFSTQLMPIPACSTATALLPSLPLTKHRLPPCRHAQPSLPPEGAALALSKCQRSTFLTANARLPSTHPPAAATPSPACRPRRRPWPWSAGSSWCRATASPTSCRHWPPMPTGSRPGECGTCCPPMGMDPGAAALAPACLSPLSWLGRCSDWHVSCSKLQTAPPLNSSSTAVTAAADAAHARRMRAMESALPEWLATQRNLMVSEGWRNSMPPFFAVGLHLKTTCH